VSRGAGLGRSGRREGLDAVTLEEFRHGRTRPDAPDDGPDVSLAGDHGMTVPVHAGLDEKKDVGRRETFPDQPCLAGHAGIDLPPQVIRSLEDRGHMVNRMQPLGIPSCGTVVLLDPTHGARIAGADVRRDCYAMAY